MRLLSVFILAALFIGCSSLDSQSRSASSQKYQVSIVASDQQRSVATQSPNKTLVVKKCEANKASCEADTQKLEYDKFSKNLKNKVMIRSVISQQISLLEQQAASLRLDRDVLKQEVEEFDRNLKMNRMSSLRDVTHNIERMRVSVSMEIAELEQKLSLTEKDLQVLKENSQQPNVAINADISRILASLEVQGGFGQSLNYKDNLIAQAIDEVIAEMM
jgi:DNA-binding Xre family transcriptional regulator